MRLMVYLFIYSDITVYIFKFSAPILEIKKIKFRMFGYKSIGIKYEVVMSTYNKVIRR